jgi:phosphatidylserine/phosphatidylglycerophosphate/cardiolipin synthase-like enzyme
MQRFVRSALLVALASCVAAEAVEDGENDMFASGKADGGIDEGSPEALGVLRLVNDTNETAASLKSGAGVTSRVANNIVNHRNGADGEPGTEDDDAFDTLAELDKIPYVGPVTLNALLERARELGYVAGGGSFDVVFSPKPSIAESHLARIADLIMSAQDTIDIAIYSYSNAQIAAALKDRAAHGVEIRFIFDTASEDRKVVDDAARAATSSGRIEADGIDVRWVNQTMHHKLLIVDGPRDDKDRADTATVVMGSANWSASAATSFDENTIIINGNAEVAAAYQHEFDRLWKGSRDFVGSAPAGDQSDAQISTADVADDPGLEVFFTSDNFTAGGTDGTTWKVDKTKTTVTDAWKAGIGRAQSSIHIATTHMRLRPFVDALVAAKQANPALDIKVYLDQQEYISPSANTAQLDEVQACLAAATTDTQTRNCLYNDFLFSKTLVDAGIDVRFKSYAYRWDHSYAAQMHSKYMVVDGHELFTGSWNHSMNSEQATFENELHLFGDAYQGVVAQFGANFDAIWETNRDALEPLRETIQTDSTIPIVYDAMALTYDEFGDLRSLIRSECPAVDSVDYRSHAASHRICTK